MGEASRFYFDVNFSINKSFSQMQRFSVIFRFGEAVIKYAKRIPAGINSWTRKP